MRVISAAIVEDNDAESAALEEAVFRYGEQKELKFEIARYKNAEDFLEKDSFGLNILFMDIELPDGMDGMRAAKKFRRLNGDTILIFVTNMKKYAINGYEVGALNYILKPINYYSFAMTLDRAMRSIDAKVSEIVRIRLENGFKMMDCRDIFYIEVMKHDVIFHTAEGVFNNYGTLNEWEKKLSSCNFVRCSSCVLVNLRHIGSLKGDDITVGGDTVRIGRSKKKSFLKSIAEFFGEKV